MQEPQGKGVLVCTIGLEAFLLIRIGKLTESSDQQVRRLVLGNEEEETLLGLRQEAQEVTYSLEHTRVHTRHWNRQQQSDALQEMVTVKIPEKKKYTRK